MPSSTGELKGRRKAAALLITIGKERSADVLRHLADDDIERLTWEISALGELSPDHRRAVLEDFENAARSHNVISLGGLEYAEDLLRLALGETKAQELIDRLSANSTTRTLRVSSPPERRAAGELPQYGTPPDRGPCSSPS